MTPPLAQSLLPIKMQSWCLAVEVIPTEFIESRKFLSGFLMLKLSFCWIWSLSVASTLSTDCHKCCSLSRLKQRVILARGMSVQWNTPKLSRRSGQLCSWVEMLRSLPNCHLSGGTDTCPALPRTGFTTGKGSSPSAWVSVKGKDLTPLFTVSILCHICRQTYEKE